jgi:hypothetical protein
MILFVTYDLKGGRDYNPFYEALKLQGPWWHYLASTWLISTGKTPQEVVNGIHLYMDPQDSLLVAEMGEHYQGYLPKQAWDWINQQQQIPPTPFFAALSGIPPTPPRPGVLSDMVSGRTSSPEGNSTLLKKILGGPPERPK